MKRVLVLVLLSLWGLPAAAAEWEVFGELLRPSYQRPEGSLWQQEFAGYPTEWDTRTTGFRVGVGGAYVLAIGYRFQ